MKILLLGEYSGFFNSLSSGLRKLGHNVTLAARKDAFKNYPVDISFEPDFFKKPVLNSFRKVIYRLFKKDIAVFEVYFKFLKARSRFKNFDFVFLINEQPITQTAYLDKKILHFIFKHNTNVYLSACGDDYQYVSYLLNDSLDYHLLQPYLHNNKLKFHYRYSLHYVKKSSKKLHYYVFKNIKAVIPADFDYVLAYQNHPKATELIPFPIQLNLLDYQEPNIEGKIIIFHGINKVNYYKKGNGYFEKALEIIQQKYADKIEISTTASLPYSEYIEKYNSCHILLDQVYSYDQGYNALEAMAKGKVVFTGAEKKWLKYHNLLEDTIALNAIPDVKKIVEKLEWLILNPNKIIEISKNARAFIEKEHHYINIANRYLNTWNEY